MAKTKETIAAPTASSEVAKKGKSAAAPEIPRIRATHPPTSNMVNAAINTLNERGGSSLYAIKKYISANYNIDAEKLSLYIKKYLKSAVADGKLVQTKGIGASGSFKLAASAKSKTGREKVAAPKKAKTATGDKKTESKKAATPTKEKKPTDKSGKKDRAVAPAKAAKASKEKPTTPQAASMMPKTPKPKKASPAKKAAVAKKAAASKKK